MDIADTEKLIAELRRLEKEATPGPWIPGMMFDKSQPGYIFPQYISGAFETGWQGSVEFIAALRNALPALLDSLEEHIQGGWEMSAELTFKDGIISCCLGEHYPCCIDEQHPLIVKVRRLEKTCSDMAKLARAKKIDNSVYRDPESSIRIAVHNKACEEIALAIEQNESHVHG